MPPASAPTMSVRTTKSRTMLRLFKNLNLALPAKRFKPDIDLVVQSFLKNVLTNRVRDTFQRRDGRHAAFFGRRNKDGLVITANIFICGVNGISPTPGEILAHPNTQTDYFADFRWRHVETGTELLHFGIDFAICNVDGNIRHIRFDEVIIDHVLEKSRLILNRLVAERSEDLALLAHITRRDNVPVDDSHNAVDDLRTDGERRRQAIQEQQHTLHKLKRIPQCEECFETILPEI